MGSGTLRSILHVHVEPGANHLEAPKGWFIFEERETKGRVRPRVDAVEFHWCEFHWSRVPQEDPDAIVRRAATELLTTRDRLVPFAGPLCCRLGDRVVSAIC